MAFYFNDGYWEAIKDLPKKQQDELAGAWVRLAFTGEEADMNGLMKAVYMMGAERVLLSMERSKNGAKGGEQSQAKRKQTSSKRQAKPKQTSSKTEVCSNEDAQANHQATPLYIERESNGVCINTHTITKEEEKEEESGANGKPLNVLSTRRICEACSKPFLSDGNSALCPQCYAEQEAWSRELIDDLMALRTRAEFER